MELIKKSFPQRMKSLGHKISSDNLLLFSSSISYYSALAIAPFLLIVLWVASLLGQDIQDRLIEHTQEAYSPEVAGMIEVIFRNLNEKVSLGSVSGAIGLLVLLWTCSLVFLQFRHAFDVIHGNYVPSSHRSFFYVVRERFFAMFIVLVGAILLIVSFTIAAVVEYYVGPETRGLIGYRALAFVLNFLIYLLLFSMIHYFAPTKRPRKGNVGKVAALSALFFMVGNILLATYFKHYARSSIYGAAGTLLVFLIWSYYSSFVIFLSAELFQYLRKIGKVR